MRNNLTILGRVVACSALLLALGSVPAAADWDFSFTPYIWGAGVSMEIEINNEPVIDADASFGDLVDSLEFALMGHFEARNEEFGLFLDGLYLDLSNKTTSQGGAMPPAPPAGTKVTTGLSMTIWELGGFYRPGGGSHGFDVLVGARVIDLSTDVRVNFPRLSPIERGRDGALTDFMIGVRYANLINDHWGYSARVDYSTGGSEGTWNAVLGLDYELGETGKYALQAGWRQMNIEVKDTKNGFKVETEVEMGGPILAFAIRW